MLSASAAEAMQCEVTGVVALFHRNLLNRVRHVGDGDAQESLSDITRVTVLPRRPGDLFGHLTEASVYSRGIERLITVRSENGREMGRLNLAHAHIGVSDSERPATAIAGRAGIGARRIRAHAETRPVEMQHGPSTGSHRVDRHHGR